MRHRGSWTGARSVVTRWVWLAALAWPGLACDRPVAWQQPGAGVPAEDQFYRVAVEQAPAGSGASLVVRPVAPWKINQEYPTRVFATSGQEEERDLRTGDAERHGDEEIRFSVEGSGWERGRARIRFSVCTPTECRFAEEQVAWGSSEESAP